MGIVRPFFKRDGTVFAPPSVPFEADGVEDAENDVCLERLFRMTVLVGFVNFGGVLVEEGVVQESCRMGEDGEHTEFVGSKNGELIFDFVGAAVVADELHTLGNVVAHGSGTERVAGEGIAELRHIFGDHEGFFLQLVVRGEGGGFGSDRFDMAGGDVGEGTLGFDGFRILCRVGHFHEDFVCVHNEDSFRRLI